MCWCAFLPKNQETRLVFVNVWSISWLQKKLTLNGSGGGCWVPGAGEDISLMFFVLRNITPQTDRIACRQGQRQGRWNPRFSQSLTRLWSSGSNPVPSPETHHSLFSIPVVCSLGSSDSRHSLLPPSQECPQALRTAFPLFRRSWLCLTSFAGRRATGFTSTLPSHGHLDFWAHIIQAKRPKRHPWGPAGHLRFSLVGLGRWLPVRGLSYQIHKRLGASLLHISAADRHACGQHPVSRKSCSMRRTANLGPVAWSLFWRRGWMWTL